MEPKINTPKNIIMEEQNFMEKSMISTVNKNIEQPTLKGRKLCDRYEIEHLARMGAALDFADRLCDELAASAYRMLGRSYDNTILNARDRLQRARSYVDDLLCRRDKELPDGIRATDIAYNGDFAEAWKNDCLNGYLKRLGLRVMSADDEE